MKLHYKYKIVGLEGPDKGISIEISGNEKLNIGQVISIHDVCWEVIEELSIETRMPEPECYCTNKVPETDCEGCDFVMSCTNCYDPSEVLN